MCAFLIKYKRKLIFNTIFSIIIIDSILHSNVFFGGLINNPEVYYLPFSFAYGTFLAVNSNKLNLNLEITLLSFLLYFIFKDSIANELFLIIAFCNLTVYIASRKFTLNFKPKYDISYGIYLWGFLIQQILYFIFGQIYAGLHFIIALIMSVAIAFISFLYIEKPFMNFGKQTLIFCNLNIKRFLKNTSVKKTQV